MATQDQKDQLIALLLTKLKPTDFDKDRLQAFLGDPDGPNRFATEFIGTYDRRYGCCSISVSDLPEPKFPDWSKGRVLAGDICRGENMDFMTLMNNAWSYSSVDSHDVAQPNGYIIFGALVSSYIGFQTDTYKVTQADPIQGHFGLAELMYLQAKWSSLPEYFRSWAKGKALCALRDIVRRNDECLYLPCLNVSNERAYILWCPLIRSWDANKVGLRWV